MKFNTKSCWLVLMLAGALALASCDKNPTRPATSLPNDSNVKIAATNAAAIYHNVQTFAQIEQAMEGPEALGKINLPAVGSLQKSGVTIQQTLRPFYQQAVMSLGQLHKTSGDSTLLDRRWTDDQTGIKYHLWIIYNTANGKAVVYTVATNYPNRNPIDRDSTRIVVNTNFTIANDKDDVVELLENAKDYRGSYRLRYEEGRLTPDRYQPGSDPKGGVIEGKRLYASGQDTAQVQERLEYHETTNPLGSWTKTVGFNNGTHYNEDIAFSQNSIIFNIIYRDGTREQGQFNVQDGNHLTFEKRVTYPAGADPRSIFEKGNFSNNPTNKSGEVNFTREVFFADGSSQKHTINIKGSEQNGFGRLEVTETNSDGTNVSWTLQEGPNQAELKGNGINEQKQYVLFNGSFYKDGSGDLHLEVYASKAAYDRGEPPIFKADIHFNPDGSGNGAITSKDGNSTFSFNAAGTPRG